MLVKKIIPGFVVQIFDTETNEYLYQKFQSNDVAKYTEAYTEREVGKIEKLLPCNMVQPDRIKK